jgi:hypothetical protein
MTDWKIVKAEKVKRKNKRVDGDHSHWIISWQHPMLGSHEFIYAADSAPQARSSLWQTNKLSSRLARYKAYGCASRVGASGVVKNLYLLDDAEAKEATQLGVPELVIKSPHTAEGSDSLVKTADFYRRIGRVAYACTRKRISSGAEVSAMIMQRLPGMDPVDLYLEAYEKYKKSRDISVLPTLSWQRMQTFAGELLAQLELLYALNGGQGIFDIKLENLLFELNAEKQITRISWLDVDSAFESGVTFTPGSVPAEDAANLYRHYQLGTRPNVVESQCFDRKICAQLIKSIASRFWSRNEDVPIVEEREIASDISGQVHYDYVYNPRPLPIVTQLKALVSAIESGDRRLLPEPVKVAWQAERVRIGLNKVSDKVVATVSAQAVSTASGEITVAEGPGGAGIGAGARAPVSNRYRLTVQSAFQAKPSENNAVVGSVAALENTLSL